MAPALWVVVSSLLFATMSALVKVAAADISLPEILFFRNLPSAMLLYAFARVRGLLIVTEHWKLHARRSLVGLSAMAFSFYSIAGLPLGTATTLEFTAPLFMMLWFFVFARRRLNLAESSAVIMGFIGLVLLLQPTLEQGELLPFLAGLAAGMCAAMAYRTLWLLGQVGEPEWRIVLLFSAAASCVALAVVPFAPSSNYTLWSSSALAGVGLLGLGSQLAMTRAFRVGSTTGLATLQYSTVIFAAGYGVLFWDDRPSTAGIAGLLLIVLSGVLTMRSINRPAELLR